MRCFGTAGSPFVGFRLSFFGSGESIATAMALGVTDYIWTIGELIEAATAPEPEGTPAGRFRVIDGGLA